MSSKSTISQKLKVAQKKLMNSKIIFKAMRIFPLNTMSYNSKNINRKNQKIDFSFESALCASFMEMEAKLRGGGFCIFLLGTGPKYKL